MYSCACARFQPLSATFTPFYLDIAPEWKSPKSAEISHKHEETNAQDARSVYINLVLVITRISGPYFMLPVMPYKSLWHPFPDTQAGSVASPRPPCHSNDPIHCLQQLKPARNQLIFVPCILLQNYEYRLIYNNHLQQGHPRLHDHRNNTIE